jgi:hypothetical protein
LKQRTDLSSLVPNILTKFVRGTYRIGDSVCRRPEVLEVRFVTLAFLKTDLDIQGEKIFAQKLFTV